MDARKESCPTKSRLLGEWQNAAKVYSHAVAELVRQIGELSKVDYERLAHVVETARKNSQDAQAVLKAHLAEHGCEDGEVAPGP